MPKLSEVAEINPTLDRSSLTDLSELVSFVPMASVSEVSGSITAEDSRLASEVIKGFTSFKDRDVLVAKITPCFENGKIAHARISNRLGFGSTEFHVVRPKSSNLDDRYLYHFLRQPAVREEGERRMTGSAGQKRVPKAFLEELDIPLPPLPEQRRIAAILDKADALRAKRRESIAKLDQLLQSVFLEMFGDPVTNPKGWPKHTLGEVSEFHAGNSLPCAVEYSGQDGGYLALKVSDMNLPGNEEFISTAASWIDGERRGAIKCPVGAVLFPKRGGAIGTNKKRVLSRPAYLDPNLMGVSVSPKQMNPVFLLHWFKQFNLSDIASGSSVPQLNKRDLEPLAVHLPLLAVQQKFAALAEQVERQKRKMHTSLAKLDGQFASLQHRAFVGEL
ncbi:restriction endonuclease subunit S [Stutzerimonas nosocomialis]|uniref:restriction endonuclease subunit S n=1 Tax=Stutzerimonas nosocomialis TaxID=1056496 RepID=UPI0013050DA9|nr:restriction endonuclease subunit S [Stutzerimonas nosocomialis]